MPLQVTEQIGEGLYRVWQLNDIVYHQKTDFQEVLIADTAHGITLFCDGERQSCDLTWRIYHEGLIVPALLTTSGRNSALVIGCSEGIASKMLRQYNFERVLHLDIDPECVRACANYLPYNGYTPEEVARYSEKDAPNPITLRFENAYKHITKGDDHYYDLIVSDLNDYSNKTQELYSEEFFKLIRGKLNEGGSFVTQAGSAAYWRNDSLGIIYKRMKRAFGNVLYFEMEEHEWSFLVGYRFWREKTLEDLQKSLHKLDILPAYIDITSLQKCTVPPISIRKQL